MGRYINQRDVYMVELDGVGSEEIGLRPCVCISSAVCNKYSEVVVFVPLTTQDKPNLPVHHMLYKSKYNELKKDSCVLCEQIRSLDRRRIGRYITQIDKQDFDQIIRKVNINLKKY